MDTTGLIVTTARVRTVRWTRHHRRVIERWPQPALPAHWKTSSTTGAGLRESFALLCGDTLIGRLTLRHIDEATRAARIGIYLHPDQVGKGYGAEILTAFGRNWSLWADVAADNDRAVRCYRWVGFVLERSFEFDGHRYLDMARRVVR
jgi:RimJ/RimL family protein N-acetyltransferase